MRKAWFVWEMGTKHPRPAIHYDNLPVETNRLNPTILQKKELDESFFVKMHVEGKPVYSDEVQPSFATLSAMFPYTGDLYSIGPKINLDQTNKMIDETEQQLLLALGPAELR
jgi:hypothetical protein